MHVIGLSRILLNRSIVRTQSQSLYVRNTLRPWPSLLSKRWINNYPTVVVPEEAPNADRPRSRLRRFVNFSIIAIISTIVGFGVSMSPMIPIVREMANLPSDAETSTMFQPSTSKIAEEEEYIQNHPIVLEYRSNPNFVEARPHLKLSTLLREHNLTAGILAGPGKLELPPLQFVEKDGKEAITIFYIGTDLCGHPGLVHGGAMATLLDESLARCCFQALPNKIGMTANLNINFRKPLPAGSFAVIRCATVKVEGRKAWVVGSLESLPKNGEPKEVYCEASALFIEPRQAAGMMKLYAGAA